MLIKLGFITKPIFNRNFPLKTYYRCCILKKCVRPEHAFPKEEDRRRKFLGEAMTFN